MSKKNTNTRDILDELGELGELTEENLEELEIELGNILDRSIEIAMRLGTRACIRCPMLEKCHIHNFYIESHAHLAHSIVKRIAQSIERKVQMPYMVAYNMLVSLLLSFYNPANDILRGSDTWGEEGAGDEENSEETGKTTYIF